MINPSYLNHCRRLLLAKREELLAAHNGEAVSEAEEGCTEADVIDQAAAEQEAVEHSRRRRAKSNRWRAIGWALVRINTGSYGNCASCGNPISRAHLRAVPWAEHCLDCMKQERAGSQRHFSPAHCPKAFAG